MISRNDVLLLLNEIKDDGVDISDMVKRLYSTVDIPLDILTFIDNRRQMDLTAFYEKLRKSYNAKKSNLYGNIVKDISDPNEILTTLSALNLQILLFAKNVEDRQMFLKHARAKEISLVLTKYFTDYDLTSCFRLLQIIKSDLCACEVVRGRRQVQ